MTQMSLRDTEYDLDKQINKVNLLLEIDCDVDKMDNASHLYVLILY